MDVCTEFSANCWIIQQRVNFAMPALLRLWETSLSDPCTRPQTQIPPTPLCSKTLALGCSLRCIHTQMTTLHNHRKIALDCTGTICLQSIFSALKLSLL